MQYFGENLKEISFPIGGIGTGCLGISGNGNLIEWEIFNRPNKRSFNNISCFAVRAKDGNSVLDARFLVGDENQDYIGRIANGYGHGMVASTLNGFPHFKANTFSGEYPFCSLDFSEKSFPGQVKLKAFNPFIPLDSKNSSLPCAFFEIEFTNTTKKELTFDAVLSINNPFGSSINEVKEKGVMLYDGEDKDNNLYFCALDGKVSIQNYWYRGFYNNFYKDNVREFWNAFSSGEKLENRNYVEKGLHDTASVLSSVIVKPNETKSIRFILGWSIPKCYNYWDRYLDKDGKDITWKNYYATIFDTSFDSVNYSINNYDYLYKKTKEFTDVLYSSTMSESFSEAVQSGLSVIKSPTISRLEDGSLYGFEGVGQEWGSCEGLCQHVFNYAYVCCYLFPDLEGSILDNTLKYGVLNDGESLMRMALPFNRKKFASSFGSNEKFRASFDGHTGFLIRIYRDWKLSGDFSRIKNSWEKIKKVISYPWCKTNEQKWDENAEGIIWGRQHHTLDCDLFGPSGWMQGFYLTFLKCGEEMARTYGDVELADICKKAYKNGYDFVKSELFNGEFFEQKIDLADKNILKKYEVKDKFWKDALWNDENKEVSFQIANGCLIDQLCGEWHSEILGNPSVFDKEQIKTALDSIYKYNFKTSMREVVNPWRLFAVNDEGGTVMCSYPKENSPKEPIPYCEEVMSGFEYSYAGLLLSNGYLDKAENVVKAVRDRYDGKKRNPYNDIECGSNYVRSMASYALLPLLGGIAVDLPNESLTFNPKTDLPFKGIFNTAVCWGSIKITKMSVELKVLVGKIKLSKINLPFAKDVKKLIIDNKEVGFSFDGVGLNFDTHLIENEILVYLK